MSRILVIDDEPDFLRLLSLRLQKEGYEVICASDGAEGLRLAVEKRPDIITLDLMMPGINGLQTLKMLRKTLYPREVPVVVVTARASQEDELELYKAGAAHYIRKPYDPKELLETIKRLEKDRPAPSAAAPSERRINIMLIAKGDVSGKLEEEIKKAGCETIVANSLQDAARIISMERPEAVFFDMSLSEDKDTYNDVWEFRYNEKVKDTPFVVLSDRDDINALKQDLDLFNIYYYLPVPCTFLDIRRAIEEVRKKRD